MGNLVVRLDLGQESGAEVKQAPKADASAKHTTPAAGLGADLVSLDISPACEELPRKEPAPQDAKAQKQKGDPLVKGPCKVTRMISELVCSEPRHLRRQLQALGVSVADSEKSRALLAVMICLKRYDGDKDLVKMALLKELKRLVVEIDRPDAEVISLAGKIGGVSSWLVHLG
ncbi:unnamed protein product [Amoebophrya sp. A25]|nr:unnamed protein product [Amoebophrya sp. A25]|eukprot:GSA25T00026684001.1